WVALAGAALFALHPDMAWVTTGGLETPVVLLLMSASLYGLAAESWGITAIASALLVLTRPDGGLWAAVVVAVALWRGRRAAIRSLGIALLLVIPWVVFAWLYFGSPMPHSVVAKQIIGQRQPFSFYWGWFLNSLGVARGGPLGGFAYPIWI